MPRYSHSKLSTFEQCPIKFKYRYIDKIPVEFEKTIEAFLGEIVHEALEWLYTEIKAKKNTLFRFNHRTLCFEMGRKLLKREFKNENRLNRKGIF